MAELSERIATEDVPTRRTLHLEDPDLLRTSQAGGPGLPPSFRFLRLPEVKRLTGLSRTAIYDKIAKDEFPPPVNLGDSRAVAWLEQEVLEWCSNCIINARGKQSGRWNR